MSATDSFLLWIAAVVYSLYKYVMHLLTGKCTLQRIVDSAQSNSLKFVHLEQTIRESHSLKKLALLETPSNDELREKIDSVITVKQINPIDQEQFSFYLSTVTKISQKYQSTIDEIKSIRLEKVDLQNVDHKNRLKSLWQNLRGVKESGNDLVDDGAIKWGDIGFQRDTDPSTDFRSMGLLGLVQLEYFSIHCGDLAREIVRRSLDIEHGYPMAIAGINLTALLFSFLVDHHLRLYFFSLPVDKINIDSFNNLFCAVYRLFHEKWVLDNPGVMQFNEQKERFRANLLAEIEDESQLVKYL